MAQRPGRKDASPPRRRGRGAKAGTPPAVPIEPTSPDGVVRSLHDAVARLATLGAAFEQVIAAAPRAADFEPLSESLYDLARHTPRIVEGLTEGPASVAPLRASVETLRGLLESLESTHAAFADSLLRLPRAEDYEPLAGPLREFARVTPALVESLREVPALARAVGEAVRSLEQATSRIEAAGQASAARPREAPAAGSGGPPALESRLEAVASSLDSARRAVAEALQTLPRGTDYAPLAAQLRELATVSPSLMEWLSEVPRVEEPLAGSVAALRHALEELSSAHGEVLACLDSLRDPDVSRRFPPG